MLIPQTAVILKLSAEAACSYLSCLSKIATGNTVNWAAPRTFAVKTPVSCQCSCMSPKHGLWTLLKADVANVQAFTFYMTSQRRILDRVPTIDSVKLYCHYVECQRWTQEANTNYDRGHLICAANVPECQAVCIATTGCSGFDWLPAKPRGQQCWLSGTWSGVRGSVQGVIHYTLDRNCAGNDFLKKLV